MSEETARAVKDAEKAHAQATVDANTAALELVERVSAELPPRAMDELKSIVHEQPEKWLALSQEEKNKLKATFKSIAEQLADQLREAGPSIAWSEPSSRSDVEAHDVASVLDKTLSRFGFAEFRSALEERGFNITLSGGHPGLQEPLVNAAAFYGWDFLEKLAVTLNKVSDTARDIETARHRHAQALADEDW